MTRMLRKQVYLDPRHDRMLKRRARQRGVTEAEIIREALDSADGAVGRPMKPRANLDSDAAQNAVGRGLGRLSSQVLGEFVSATTRGRRPVLIIEEALAQVARLADAMPVLDITRMIVLEAARGVHLHRLSYYDAQIWATARLNQVATVLGHDRHARVVLPFKDGTALFRHAATWVFVHDVIAVDGPARWRLVGIQILCCCHQVTTAGPCCVKHPK